MRDEAYEIEDKEIDIKTLDSEICASEPTIKTDDFIKTEDDINTDDIKTEDDIKIYVENEDNFFEIEIEKNVNKEKIKKAKDKKQTKKSVDKNIVIAMSVVMLFVVGFSIGLPLYLRANKVNRDLHANQKIMVVNDGSEVGVYALEQLIALVPPVEFSAVYKPNLQEAIVKTYTGIRVIDLLTALDISLEGKKGAVFGCRDGPRTRNTGQIKDKNLYIAYKVNGKYIPVDSASGESGGMYVVIDSSAEFSNTRIKWLVSIEIV